MTTTSIGMEFLDWVFTKIDKNILLDNFKWIEEKIKNDHWTELLDWCSKQLSAEDLKEIMSIILNSLSNDNLTVNKTMLTFFMRDYNNGNALAAWQAVQYCAKENENYPDWVKLYLLEVANNLLSIDKAEKLAPQLALKALKLKGKNFSYSYHGYSNDWKICAEIERLVAEGRNFAAAYRKYSKDNKISIETVKKTHLKMRKYSCYEPIIAHHLQRG
jgi:hypothetical protein